MRTILSAIAGVFIAILFVIGFLLMGRESGTEIASEGPAPEVIAERQAPATRANPMTPVTEAEAARRSELHERLASPEAARSAAVMAPSVITEVRAASNEDAVSRELFGDAFPSTPEIARVEPEPEPEPEPETVAEVEPEPEPEPEPNRYDTGGFRERFRTNIEQPGSNFGVRNFGTPAGYGTFDSSMLDLDPGVLRDMLGMDRMAHLDQGFQREEDQWFEPYRIAGGLVVEGTLADPLVQAPVRPQYNVPNQSLGYGATGYGAPRMEERSAARPALTNVDDYGQPYTTGDAPNPYLAGQQGSVVLARSGDMISATLLYGFNSDDVRGLPIYAIIHDYLPNGTAGPLNGARAQGQVAYSNNNAAIIFETLVLTNGREFPMSAIAVGGSGRPGVAENVNRHVLSRYGSLFLSGIIEGVGEVAQARLRPEEGGTTIIIGGDGDISANTRSRDEPTDREIIAGSLAPVGRNMSSAAERGFNRSPTISAPAGLPFAMVFVRTVVSDPAEANTAFNPRTNRMEVVGDVTPDQGEQTRVGATGSQPQQGMTIPETGDVYTPATSAPPDSVWQSLEGQ